MDFFKIAMAADYSFEVKNIEIWVPAFFKHSSSSVSSVKSVLFFVFMVFARHVDKWFSTSFFVDKRSWVRSNLCHRMSHCGPFGTVLIHT